MSDALRHYTNEFRSRRDVSPYDAEFLFDSLIAEKDEDLLTDLFTAWSAKGSTEDEIFRFANILRSRMKQVDTRGLSCVDIVGTGGSVAKTFNVSTAAAFVVAGAGVPVAKHGNRAATSSSGSSDVLSCLGVEIDIEPAKAEENLHKHGLTFMFAPRHHSLSPELARARKRVGAPTIFNCIGPLCNPAVAGHQLIGVWDASLITKMARALLRFGSKHSWIVHGEGGLDEISLNGKTHVAEIRDGSVNILEIAANDFGIETGDESSTTVTGPDESATVIQKILQNELKNSADENLVIINAAAAIYLASGAGDLRSAAKLAVNSIRNRNAMNKLEELRSTRR